MPRLQKKLIAEGKTGPEWHEPSRPGASRPKASIISCTFAEMHGAHIYIVHTSNSDAIAAGVGRTAARRARSGSKRLRPYLVLDETYAEKPNFEGANTSCRRRCAPSGIRTPSGTRCDSRIVSTIATDHAPFDFKGQKEMGRDDFTKIPNGIPQLEDRVNLLYTYGVKRGRIDLNTFVDACSTQAAKLFGLFPRKGTIALGSDADLVVYDPELPRQDFSRRRSR